MKYLLAILILISVSAGATTYTNSVSGNWSVLFPSLVGGDSLLITNGTKATNDLNMWSTNTTLTNGILNLTISSGAAIVFSSNNNVILLFSNTCTLAGSGQILYGSAASPVGMNITNTPSAQIVFMGTTVTNSMTGVSNIIAYGDTSHQGWSRLAYPVGAGSSTIVVSNVPANLGSNDVLWLSASGISNNTAYSPLGYYYVIASVVTNATFPYSNSITFKPSLAGVTNFWQQGSWTNVTVGGITNGVGSGVAFVSCPIVFGAAGGNLANNKVPCNTTNYFQGVRFSVGGNGMSTANNQFFNCVSDAGSSSAGISSGVTNSYTSCISVGLSTGSIGYGANSYYTNCAMFSKTGVQVGASSLVNNCIAFASSLFYSALNAQINNSSDFYCGSVSSQSGLVLNNHSRYTAASLTGAGNLPGCSINNLFMTNIYSSTTYLFHQGNNAWNARINGMTSSTNLPLFQSASDCEVYGYNQSDTSSVFNPTFGYVPININNKYWASQGGTAILTNNFITFTFTTNGTAYAYFKTTVNANSSKTAAFAFQRTNNVRFRASFGQFANQSSTPTINTVGAADNAWTNQNLAITVNNTQPYQVSAQVWISATATNACTPQCQVFISGDTLKEEF